VTVRQGANEFCFIRSSVYQLLSRPAHLPDLAPSDFLYYAISAALENRRTKGVSVAGKLC